VINTLLVRSAISQHNSVSHCDVADSGCITVLAWASRREQLRSIRVTDEHERQRASKKHKLFSFQPANSTLDQCVAITSPSWQTCPSPHLWVDNSLEMKSTCQLCC